VAANCNATRFVISAHPNLLRPPLRRYDYASTTLVVLPSLCARLDLGFLRPLRGLAREDSVGPWLTPTGYVLSRLRRNQFLAHKALLDESQALTDIIWWRGDR